MRRTSPAARWRPTSTRSAQLEAFLGQRGLGLADAEREDVEAFLAHVLEHWKPATAPTGYRTLKVLYRWMEEEGEIDAAPMAKMKLPTVPHIPSQC